MLTIHEGFPIKKMTLYGSAAFLVGFAGTLTMLREYIPKDDSGNISVVHPSNKQEPKSNVSNQVPKTENKDNGDASTPVTPLAQSTPVAGGGALSTRQASPPPITTSNGTATNSGAMTVTPSAPTASTPTVSSASQSASGGSSSSTVTTQPTPTTQPSSPLSPVPILQQTVTDLNKTTSGLLP